MNWSHFSSLFLFCTSILASCSARTMKGASSVIKEFTFDLSKGVESNEYSLKRNRNFSSTTSVLEPNAQNKLTKIVDGHENVATFFSDQIVTKVVFTPSVNPILLSVTYIKNNFLHTRRFRKLYGWNEITVDDYNYLMFEACKAPEDVVLDVSKIDSEVFTVKRENYGTYEMLNVTVPQRTNIKKVLNGKQVVWVAKDNEKVINTFVSVDSTPQMLCFSVLRDDKLQLKMYTNFSGDYNEVEMSEFRFVLLNLMTHHKEESKQSAPEAPELSSPSAGKVSTPSLAEEEQKDLTLDLSNLDVTEVEMTYGVLDRMAFVSVHPLKKEGCQEKVTRVLVDGYELWKTAGTSECVNVAYTVETEPRFYHLLVSDEQLGTYRDKVLYYMKEDGKFYSLKESEYNWKVMEVGARGRQVSEGPMSSPTGQQLDLEKLMRRLGKEDWRTLMFAPGQGNTVSTVTCGKDLVWVARSNERLDLLYFFKNGPKSLLQLVVTDDSYHSETRYFMYEEEDTEPDFSDNAVSGPGAKSSPTSATTANMWLWVSSAVFFSNVAQVQLVKTYLSLDVTSKVDKGVVYHKEGQVGRVYVRSFTTYPSNAITALFEKENQMWSASDREEVLSLSVYTPGRANPDKGVSAAEGSSKLAELYVKIGDKLKRVFLASDGEDWKPVQEADFKFMYRRL